MFARYLTMLLLIQFMELIKVELEVLGQPQGKGRLRFTRNGHTYTPQKTKDYESQIQAAAGPR